MSARDLALLNLDRLDLPDWASGSLSSPASLASSREARPSHDPRDADLAARIEIATIKNLLQINQLIAYFANRPIGKIDLRVRKIIGIAIAQILHLDRIPPSAAVDEAVKQARRFGRTSAAGFVNAVLRRATREPLPRFPSAEENPSEHARIVLSHLPELFDRLVNLLGTADAIRYCEHNNRRPPTILRVSPVATLDVASHPGVAITPHEQAGMVVIHPTPHELLRTWARLGIAQAQDPTSAAVVDRVDVKPGLRVLDRCCGLGTKTMQLRERLGETGELIAIDPDGPRIDALNAMIKSRGYQNIQPIQTAWLTGAGDRISARGFDLVLIDVPCSNSGVLARRSAARYSQSAANLASLEKLQLAILSDTADATIAGGLLIYSTCSIWPEENQAIVQKFIAAHPDFELISEESTLPSFQTDNPSAYHDGGFVAVMRKVSSHSLRSADHICIA